MIDGIFRVYFIMVSLSVKRSIGFIGSLDRQNSNTDNCPGHGVWSISVIQRSEWTKVSWLRRTSFIANGQEVIMRKVGEYTILFIRNWVFWSVEVAYRGTLSTGLLKLLLTNELLMKNIVYWSWTIIETTLFEWEKYLLSCDLQNKS